MSTTWWRGLRRRGRTRRRRCGDPCGGRVVTSTAPSPPPPRCARLPPRPTGSVPFSDRSGARSAAVVTPSDCRGVSVPARRQSLAPAPAENLDPGKMPTLCCHSTSAELGAIVGVVPDVAPAARNAPHRPGWVSIGAGLAGPLAPVRPRHGRRRSAPAGPSLFTDFPSRFCARSPHKPPSVTPGSRYRVWAYRTHPCADRERTRKSRRAGGRGRGNLRARCSKETGASRRSGAPDQQKRRAAGQESRQPGCQKVRRHG